MNDYLLPKELIDQARKVVEANRAAGKRISVAESCTGGLVSAAITEISGSSDVFEAGYVTYSNAAKIAALEASRRQVETRLGEIGDRISKTQSQQKELKARLEEDVRRPKRSE